MIRTAGIIIFVVLTTLVNGTLAICASFFSRTGNAVHIIGRFWARSILFAARIPVEVRGVENLPKGRSVILMPNHQSNFDIPVLLAHLPVQFRWLAKAELYRIPVLGRAMRGAGYISIDRSDRKSAFKSLEAAARTIREGTSVLIFPEGTRSNDGRLGPFKKGGFVLAVDSGVPLVPITISGTWEIMPKNRLLICPGRVKMQIHPPIDTSLYTRKTKDKLMEEVRKSILSEG